MKFFNHKYRKKEIQPVLCLAAPRSQPGRGTGCRALLKEKLTSTKHRQGINEVKDTISILILFIKLSSKSDSKSDRFRQDRWNKSVHSSSTESSDSTTHIGFSTRLMLNSLALFLQHAFFFFFSENSWMFCSCYATLAFCAFNTDTVFLHLLFPVTSTCFFSPF